MEARWDTYRRELTDLLRAIEHRMAFEEERLYPALQPAVLRTMPRV